ncbi:SGNH/GDSL hydrolase family protein [Marinobacter halodurans]|uniref:SGNH/GDSL hydrolase family protein n=1 Tax=Marinobacter halodurans TaxID=2528979 RepID=A0ABY1ZPB9_9GAMM|nr:GDSL-type esterase/lipase family protein [Marinobacter halodurans]TBW55896.1 SGNH/GDSL hydrolase family protein [Marinobacter halodurans]
MPENGCIVYGDCNTEGIAGFSGELWPDRVAHTLGLPLVNCGHTMSTTRELRRYARSFPPAGFRLAFIQYGLVDSWLTFRGAPYVLYYPDNPLRKLARKWVKTLKKRARRWQLQDRWGAVEQVPLAEYIAHIHAVVTAAPDTQFVLVGTAPNLEEPRNPRIRQYNRALAELADQLDNAVHADAYAALWADRHHTLMDDGTHLTDKGHCILAGVVLDVIHRRVAA